MASVTGIANGVGVANGAGKASVTSMGERGGLSLAARIILLNAFAMFAALVGMFYFGNFTDRLLSAEISKLTDQAQLIANTLGEVAVENSEQGDGLRIETTRQIVRRLIEKTEMRTQVFAPNTRLVADSRLLMGAGRYVQIEQLPPPSGAYSRMSWMRIQDFFRALVMIFPYKRNLPVYHETALPRLEQMPDVKDALQGRIHWTLWQTTDKELVLTVAVPVQRLRQVVGAVMVTRSSEQLAEGIRELRLDLLRSFAGILGISIVLSLYMAQTIALPLKRLARAARRAGVMKGEPPSIPDYAGRGDEVAELSIALQSMTQALWHRLGAIEGFAADVAHELKNPLTSMHSAIETLSRVTDPEKRERLLTILRDDLRRMERLITDISAMSRLDAEIARTPPEDIDLADFAEMLVANRAQGGAEVEFIRDEGAYPVRGIPGRLEQVLQNLIDNALSFTKNGKGVCVRVQEQKQNRHWVRLTVDDFGDGIARGREEKIFERFYSARPEGEVFGNHSGLGLSICRQIIEGHGGKIRAENRLGEDGETVIGARFTVDLPKGGG